ncbi:MAG: hypothetical protein ABUT20_48865 [Bacteroidota bacterium]
MKKQNSEINTYPAPVLRVAFRNSFEPAILRQLPETGIRNRKPQGEALPDMGKTKIQEFYQHHINPKRFDFF